jgi:23S rRNA pseudouridine955/2504/2580 synthase
MEEIKIGRNDAGRRLDRFLRRYLAGAPLGTIYKVIRKDAKVNGRRRDSGYVLEEGDVLTLYIKEEDLRKWTAAGGARGRGKPKARRTFGIVYEDENILAADKPFGLLTHGDSREKKNHLANQVMDYLIERGEYDPREKVFSPAPANRLDRNTTGLVLFGKNAEALRSLNEMIRTGMIDKYYLTIVYGDVDRELDLTGRLTKDEESNRAFISPDDSGTGRAIETVVRPLEKLGGCTLVEILLVTGRTHQIRAHMASIGHPVIGDTKYAKGEARRFNSTLRDRYGLTTQLLHSSRLEFRECTDDLGYLKGKTIEAPLPEKFGRIAEGLRRNKINE